NIELSAALFRNQVGTMTFENPLTISPSSIAGIGANAFTQGRFASDPDNDYTSARLDLARSFPDWFNARFSASLALGRTRQNETLLAPTSLALTGASLNGIAADGLWNSAAALTRGNADARIDTRLAVLTASLQPIRSLSLLARYRDDSTDSTGDYQACNPQTGQLGRLLNDGSGAALVDVPQYLAARCDLAAIRALGITPDAGDITLRNAPFEQRNRTLEVTADWRVSRSASLATEFEHKETRRPWRERERTSEDRVKLSFTERGFDSATVRASVEYAARGGSAYRRAAGAERLSASLGPLPSSGNVSSWFGSVDQLRKFDLADRTRTTVHLRADFALGEGFDAAVDFTGRYALYPRSEVGRSGREQQNALGFDANYVAADGIHLYGFYAYQDGQMRQVGAQPAGCLIGLAGVTADNVEQCGAFGGPLFPRDRAWESQSRDRNHVVGLGGRFEFRWGVVDLDYTHVHGRTSIDYAYGTGIVLSPAREALAGSGWPDLRFSQGVLAASAWFPLTRRASMRLRLQAEAGQVDDWHYDGIAANPVPLPSTVYLNSAAQRYRTIFGGIFLRLAL
ncbi:MAG TPA: MtrB/PioB family outer membrane beta-barrel protein, partial [Burkholderiaceae bacterium]|nr:MtrB/PioB family outer membrane beta-barrel protein [Burkholderiaceae bacterium]